MMQTYSIFSTTSHMTPAFTMDGSLANYYVGIPLDEVMQGAVPPLIPLQDAVP